MRNWRGKRWDTEGTKAGRKDGQPEALGGRRRCSRARRKKRREKRGALTKEGT